MPRGKYTRKNKRTENALTTRLMQISLKMDDHIYYDKLISAAEAAAYLQEIATLKLQCSPTNVRALQVIEKLTRCMRSIIVEEEAATGSISYIFFPIGNDFIGSASPVYSLPDEDRTCDIGEQDDVEIIDDICILEDNETLKNHLKLINKPNKDVSLRNTINHKSNPATQAGSLNQNDTIEDIDITKSVISNAEDEVSKEQNSIIENVNIGISNMAIQDEVSKKIHVLRDDICSQSILDNYDGENINNPNKKTTVVEMNSPFKRGPKGQVIKSVNNYFTERQSTSTEQEFDNSQQIHVDLTGNIASVETGPTLMAISNKRKQRKKVNSGKVPTKGNANSTASNPALNVPSLNTTTNNATVQNNLLSNTSKTTKRRIKKKPHELYNNSVVNDLSWIENVRYVREICPEEYDPLLTFPDSFWDNFSLPNSWSDLDFEY